jgi:hypothetical protein
MEPRKPRLTAKRFAGIRWAVLSLAEENPEDFASGVYEQIQAAVEWVRDMDKYRRASR